jgi:hypothetical protein
VLTASLAYQGLRRANCITTTHSELIRESYYYGFVGNWVQTKVVQIDAFAFKGRRVLLCIRLERPEFFLHFHQIRLNQGRVESHCWMVNLKGKRLCSSNLMGVRSLLSCCSLRARAISHDVGAGEQLLHLVAALPS